MTPRVLNKRTATVAELAEAVYVGRPTKWGNPFTHIPSKVPGVYTVKTRERAIACYRDWLINKHPELVEEARRALRGKHLVCWCAPQPCHADILLDVANAGDPPTPPPPARVRRVWTERGKERGPR